MTFNMDGEWKRSIEQAVQEGMRTKAQEVQSLLDRLRLQYVAQPIEVIRPALASAWRGLGDGASVSEPELTQYAEAISSGRRIIIQPENFQLK